VCLRVRACVRLMRSPMNFCRCKFSVTVIFWSTVNDLSLYRSDRQCVLTSVTAIIATTTPTDERHRPVSTVSIRWVSMWRIHATMTRTEACDERRQHQGTPVTPLIDRVAVPVKGAITRSTE
jgi:hypothetical protein